MKPVVTTTAKPEEDENVEGKLWLEMSDESHQSGMGLECLHKL